MLSSPTAWIEATPNSSFVKQPKTRPRKYVDGGSGIFWSARVQLEWYFQTLSARSSAYGIQPIWPSAYESFSSGKRTSTPENKKSASDAIELLHDSMTSTSGGASGDAAGIFDDEPMCIQTVVRVCWQAAKNGSQ